MALGVDVADLAEVDSAARAESYQLGVKSRREHEVIHDSEEKLLQVMAARGKAIANRRREMREAEEQEEERKAQEAKR